VPAPCVVLCFSMRIVRGIPDSRVQLGISSRRVLDRTVRNGSLISVGGVILALMAGCCKILHAFGITCVQHEADRIKVMVPRKGVVALQNYAVFPLHFKSLLVPLS